MRRYDLGVRLMVTARQALRDTNSFKDGWGRGKATFVFPNSLKKSHPNDALRQPLSIRHPHHIKAQHVAQLDKFKSGRFDMP